MTEVPWWVAVLLGSVFVAFGAGLAYASRGIERWARNTIWAKCAMWSAAGLAITVGHWLPGVGTALLAAAGVSRLLLGLGLNPWRPPRTDPTPGSPPGPR